MSNHYSHARKKNEFSELMRKTSYTLRVNFYNVLIDDISAPVTGLLQNSMSLLNHLILLAHKHEMA